MSFVLQLHPELTKDRATQPFAKLLIAMPWKRRLFAVQVDLGVLRTFNEPRTQARQLPSKLGSLHRSVALGQTVRAAE